MIGRTVRSLAIALFVCVLLSGCSRFKSAPPDQYVYVTSKQAFLRDRVAAVSNRTGTVENGQKLKVLERGRRFLRVETDKNETGWIDEKTIATQETYDSFATLQHDHASDPAVASAVVRDEVYLHLEPGRSTQRFYRLAEGEKLSLLKRATLPRGGGPNPKATPAKNPRQAAIPGAATGIKPQPATPQPATPQPAAPTAPAAKGAATAAKPADASAIPGEPPTAPPMEDWWLVRDAHGRTGWMLSRLMDVDVPDSVARYSEGQRIVGAYVLARVYDAEAPQDDKNVPEYVTVLSPYKAGLTYDFDQVRVFIWNTKMHRYETSFRERNIEGYLPVELKPMKDPSSKVANASAELPGFTYKLLPAGAAPVIPDPETGAIVPGPTIAKSYRLEGNIVRRMLAPGAVSPEEAHPEPDTDKKDKKGAKRPKHK